MPITYKHLFDQDGFTSESINSRFELAMGTGVGVNAITPNDVSVGAFRHEHLPVAIHKAGASKALLKANAAFTASSTGGFSASVAIIPKTAIATGSSFEIGSLVYPARLQYGLGQSSGTLLPDRIGAVIVLANVSVAAFVDGAPTTRPVNEDVLGLNAFIRVVTSTPTNVDFTRSIRSVSPRVLISDDATTAPNFSGSVAPMADLWTFQDVPIRMVIRPVDIGLGTPEIHEIQLRAYLTGSELSSGNWTAQVTKWNLTAIPLHTDYVEMS